MKPTIDYYEIEKKLDDLRCMLTSVEADKDRSEKLARKKFCDEWEEENKLKFTKQGIKQALEFISQYNELEEAKKQLDIQILTME